MFCFEEKYFSIEAGVKEKRRQLKEQQMAPGSTGEMPLQQSRNQEQEMGAAREEDNQSVNYFLAYEQLSYGQKAMELLRNTEYICLVLSLAAIYFCLAGIQFWMPDYGQVVLGEDPVKVYIYFAFTCITAPTLGVIVCGGVTQKLGGYESPKALKVACCLLVACFGVVLPMPLVTKLDEVLPIVWLLLFCGGYAMPCITGCMLSSVQPHQKTFANSMAYLLYNLLGYLPAPFLYGLISTLTGGAKSKWGMVFIFYSVVFVPITAIIGYSYKLKRFAVEHAPSSENSITESLLENQFQPMEGRNDRSNTALRLS